MEAVKSKYANLFEMYERITDDDPTETPMRIYPAVHYTMGGLWVDYNLMTNLDGLFSIGESNFADHGANRLGASSLMQCLADGYFIIPVTIGDFLSRHEPGEIETDHPAFQEVEDKPENKSTVCFRFKEPVHHKSSIVSLERSCGSTVEFLETKNPSIKG